MNSSERTKILKKIKLPDIFIKKGGLAYYLVKEKDLIILVGVYVDSNMDKESFYSIFYTTNVCAFSNLCFFNWS